jgi:hypothetical protein
LTAKDRSLLAALFLLALLAPGPAGAAEPFPKPPATASPIITDNASIIATGAWSIEPYWQLGVTAGQFSPNWRRVSAGGDFATFSNPWQIFYGPFKNAEINVIVPYIQNWGANVREPSLGPGSHAATFGGLGDLKLTGKYQLLEETWYRPLVSATAKVTFPTGHHLHFNPARLGLDQLGAGAYAFTLGFDVEKYLPALNLKLYGNFWYTLATTDTLDRTRVHNRDQVTINLAAEYPLSQRWVALVEIYQTWDGGTLLGPRSHQGPVALLGFLPGLEYLLNPSWYFEVGVSVDSAGKNTAFKYTPIVTVIYNFS